MTARRGTGWLLTSDPLQKEKPAALHRHDIFVKISKLLGRLAKGVLSWGSRMAPQQIAHQTCPQRSPLPPPVNRQEEGAQQRVHWLHRWLQEHVTFTVKKRSGKLYHQNSPWAVTLLELDPETLLQRSSCPTNLLANSGYRSSGRNSPSLTSIFQTSHTCRSLGRLTCKPNPACKECGKHGF